MLFNTVRSTLKHEKSFFDTDNKFIIVSKVQETNTEKCKLRGLSPAKLSSTANTEHTKGYTSILPFV